MGGAGLGGKKLVAFSAVQFRQELGRQTFRRTVVNDLALFQGHGTGAEAHGVIHLVQGHHNGEAILLVEVAQGLHDIAGRFRVQRGDGLVSQQHAGTLHQSTGDGGTLLLPAGKGTGALPGLFPDSHAGQGPKGKLPVIRVESTGQAAPQTSAGQSPQHDVAGHAHTVLLDSVVKLCLPTKICI